MIMVTFSFALIVLLIPPPPAVSQRLFPAMGVAKNLEASVLYCNIKVYREASRFSVISMIMVTFSFALIVPLIPPLPSLSAYFQQHPL